MEEEFTTKMHAELLGNEMSKEELYTCAIYGAVRRGEPLAKALQRYKMTREEYEKNVKKYILNY